MAEVIFLGEDESAPDDEPCLVVEWSDGMSTFSRKTEHSLYYKIGRPKHKFWSTEIHFIARRFGLKTIYYVGRPLEVAWPIDLAKGAEPVRRRRTRRGLAV